MIIGLVGYKGVGKDEVARLLATRGFVNLKFAEPIKEMLRLLLGRRGANSLLTYRMIEGDLKEVPSPFLEGKTPRHAMQTLGTEWGRACLGGQLWVNTLRAQLPHFNNVVVTDVRFLNEAAMLRAEGAELWRITRPGFEGDGHASERDIEKITCDFLIQNHNGFLELEQQVKAAL